MSDSKKDPNPIEDVRKGLGLLFRAAKTAAQKLPTTKFEEVVLSGAKEVGRAMESVAQTLEKEVVKRTSGGSKSPSSSAPPPGDGATGTSNSGPPAAEPGGGTSDAASAHPPVGGDEPPRH